MGMIVAALTAILNFIIHVLCFAAKLIYRLIRALGLQFPFLYLVVMLIVELATGRGISSDPQFLSLFWLGLVLSLVLAGWYALRRIFFPKKKREEAYYRKKFEREQEREREKAQRRESGRAQPLVVDPGIVPAGEAQTVAPPPAAPLSAGPAADLRAEEEAAPEAPMQEEGVAEDGTPSLPDPKTISFPARSRQQKKTRYPLVYRVRQDERFLLYEYEDRYELYLERPTGLKYVRTDAK